MKRCGRCKTFKDVVKFNKNSSYCKSCNSNAIKEHKLKMGPLYSKWKAIKTRCNNPNYYNYKNYGGRGITVCAEWSNDFISFKEWAIETGWENGLTIDRIDNNGPYSPDNCQWLSPTDNLKKRWKDSKAIK